MLALPNLSLYDPPTSSEGTIDPLGLYQIADQLATRLVPAVRERMQRIRFLTAMSVGALVTEGLEADPEQPECPPFLVWEWLVVESLIRSSDDEALLRGVPGTLVTRRALANHNYLDSRSYLKTPRIIGFHGVYKRLAVHLGLVDVHLGAGSLCEELADAWAKDQGFQGYRGAKQRLEEWKRAVRRGLAQQPCRTRPGWNLGVWGQLATAMHPDQAGKHERKVLQQLLHSEDERALGALPAIWRLQTEFMADGYTEESLHTRLKETLPSVRTLLDAIVAYEDFCRGLFDGFDLIRFSASGQDSRGFEVASIGKESDFVDSLKHLDARYEEARSRLHDVDSQLASFFDERFARFAEPMNAAESARAICEHHENIQKAKSAEGKRPWFDRLDPARIYMRHRYRLSDREIQPSRYVHDYRGKPLRNFYLDLNH